MRHSTLALAGAALLFGSAMASARGDNAVAPDAKDEVIAGRKAAFLMSAGIFGGLKAAVDRGDDVKTLAFPTRGLARWAAALPGMFPAGSTSDASEALPVIWTDRAGFEARAAAYAEATAKLADLARAGDKAGFAAQLGVVNGTCAGCHDTYRKPK
ncbi:c-type cytochrome [Sphingomonas soli]|uniref:c-type cytochrome n=1 Tax=Sphingomonas soli TaxID=266127 RepID=UPI0014702757|nr:cytochrome c [Sphingomonas soli]